MSLSEKFIEKNIKEIGLDRNAFDQYLYLSDVAIACEIAKLEGKIESIKELKKDKFITVGLIIDKYISLYESQLNELKLKHGL